LRDPVVGPVGPRPSLVLRVPARDPADRAQSVPDPAPSDEVVDLHEGGLGRAHRARVLRMARALVRPAEPVPARRLGSVRGRRAREAVSRAAPGAPPRARGSRWLPRAYAPCTTPAPWA